MRQDHVVKRKQNINTKVGLNPRNFSKLCVFRMFIHTHFPLTRTYVMKGNPWKWNNSSLFRRGIWKNLYMHVNLYVYIYTHMLCMNEYIYTNMCMCDLYVYYSYVSIHVCILYILLMYTVCIYLHNICKFTLSALLRDHLWWLSR